MKRRKGEKESRMTDQGERVRHEFLLILLATLPLQVIYPVFSGGSGDRPVIVLFFSLILISGVWIMRGIRRRFLMAAILTLVSLELLWISLWPAAASLLPAGEFCVLLFLLILSRWSISTFIKTDLTPPDLLLAATSLFLLTGTTLGLLLFLMSGLYPAPASGGMGTSLSVYLAAGISILTMNGSGLILNEEVPLVRVGFLLGMIGGVLMIVLTIGKMVVALAKKDGPGE
jgi:hypothetical protein